MASLNDDEMDDLLDQLAEEMATAIELQRDVDLQNDLRRNRISGMMLGHTLGDILGAPHEFRNQVPLANYTGRIEHPLTIVRRFQGGRLSGNLGQASDDTEMMIALTDAIISKRGVFDETEAISEYRIWANSKCPFLGNNTRFLFGGLKTNKGYAKRRDSARAVPEEGQSASNGCLMRCPPLAVLSADTWCEATITDCRITNFPRVCSDSVVAYVCALRELIAGASPGEATAAALRLELVEPVMTTIREAGRQIPRNVADERKGWVLHALHCAFYALNMPSGSFEDRLDTIIRLGGDTDTNGAIAGAMLGAACGEQAMREEARTSPNIDVALAVDVSRGDLPRPAKYGADRIPELAAALADIDAIQRVP